MFAYFLLLTLSPIVNSFLTGGSSGCCCSCGIPQPAFCGCQIQIPCPPPVPCLIRSCPVCQACPPAVRCPPPPVAVCPAPQPVYVQPACGGEGCGGSGGPRLGLGFGGPGEGYAFSGEGFGGEGGGGQFAAAGRPGGLGSEGFTSGGCIGPDCKTPYIFRPTTSEGFPTAMTSSASSYYGPSLGSPTAGIGIPSYSGPPLAPQITPEITFSEPALPPSTPLGITPSQGIGYSEGSRDLGGTFADGAPQRSAEAESDNEQNAATANQLTDEERNKNFVESQRMARGTKTTTDPKCNSDVLMKLILKNIVAENAVGSKRAIHKIALRDINDAIIDIICSDASFTYIISTAEYCEAQRDKVICFAYKKP